jgi:adenylate cyclase class IV
MNFKELEYKYDADEVSLKEFEALVNEYEPRWMMVSSYDEYFVKKDDDFIRYRYHDNNGELTIKKKTTEANNNTRFEVNMKVEPNGSKNVYAFVDAMGYKFNFKIFKTCKIAFLEKVVLVYYVVYDAELNEKRRFIEIEANEDYNWPSEQAAWDEIHAYEDKFFKLGLSPQRRLRKSLFEIFRAKKTDP